ncbi:MAG TPA: hypothetical protein VFQ63_02685 [Patescibacteria group bacterium]|nr:hypothetical protein [Patescibacteria group bacterium]
MAEPLRNTPDNDGGQPTNEQLIQPLLDMNIAQETAIQLLPLLRGGLTPSQALYLNGITPRLIGNAAQSILNDRQEREERLRRIQTQMTTNSYGEFDQAKNKLVNPDSLDVLKGIEEHLKTERRDPPPETQKNS